MDKKEYKKLVDKKTMPSKVIKNTIMAFIVGGSICTIGQIFRNIYESLGLGEELTGSAVSVTMIFLGILLTGLNIYPKIVKWGGAGALVPITGFANSVAAPAIEYKAEGQVYGIGCKIFTIAGPVILYGIFASWVLGFLYWIGKIMGVV